MIRKSKQLIFRESYRKVKRTTREPRQNLSRHRLLWRLPLQLPASASNKVISLDDKNTQVTQDLVDLKKYIEDIGLTVPPHPFDPKDPKDPNVPSTPTDDGCIDFEDLVPGSVYTSDPAMDTFTSEGYKFEIVEESSAFVQLPPVPGDGFVIVKPSPPPAVANITHQFGQFLGINNKVLKFDVEQVVPGGASSGCFNYADLGGYVYLRINGSSYKFDTDTVATPLGEATPGTSAPDMSSYHGLVLGGVQVHVTRFAMPGGHCGTVFLMGGPIKIVEVGGQELFVDRYCFPCIGVPDLPDGDNDIPTIVDPNGVPGSASDENSVGFQVPGGHILWNLQGSGELISGSGVIGNILAPSSSIQSGGVINGQVVIGGTVGIDSGDSDAYNHLMDGTGITLAVISNKIVRQVCIDFEDIPSGLQYKAVEDSSVAVPPEIRIRPEITAMTPEDRRGFFLAFRAVYENPDNRMKDLINRHQAFFSRGLHNNGAFLPWHRGYILELENIIREHYPNMTVPYWDWGQHPQINTTSFFGVADDHVSGDGDSGTRVVNGGTFGHDQGFALTNGRPLQRRIGGGMAASTEEIQTQLHDRYPEANSYDQFRNRLEHGSGLHDSVHCIVGEQTPKKAAVKSILQLVSAY